MNRKFMKKSFLFRLIVLSVIAVTSFMLAATPNSGGNIDQQAVEELPASNSSREKGEFLILESITRYLMASYQ